MKLWVKCQNKGLHSIIGIDEPHVQDNGVALIGYNEYKHIKLGFYKNESRALEVLNNIQNIINAKTIIKFKEFVPTEHIKRVKDAIDENSIIELPSYEIKELAGVIVYEMPKE